MSDPSPTTPPPSGLLRPSDRLDRERMFVAVLETGSFAAAAVRLGTSPSQASKLVSRLEAQLGVQLIRRSTRALSPTEAGEALLPRYRRLIDEFDGIEDELRSRAGQPVGRLRLSVPMSFGLMWLQPLLLDFSTAHAAIALDVRFEDRETNLVNEGFDLAIRIGRPRDSGLIGRRLSSTRLVTVAAPAYLAANPSPQHPRDLASHACILDSNYRDPDLWSFAAPERISVAVNGRLRFSNGEACLQAARQGLGVARMPSFLLGDDLRAGRLVRLLPEHEGEPLAVLALYPPTEAPPMKVRALMDFLAERLKGQPQWERGWP